MAGGFRSLKPAGRKPKQSSWSWKPLLKNLTKLDKKQLILRLLAALGFLLLASLLLARFLTALPLTFRIGPADADVGGITETDLGVVPAVASPAEADQHSAKSQLSCDDSGTDEGFPYARPAVCSITGDVRISSANSTAVTAVDAAFSERRMRPYARKDESLMPDVREILLRAVAGAAEAPGCSVKYDIPGVVFSIGGYSGNFFHDMADVLVPLFLTSYYYKGEVQYFVANYKQWWIQKYKPLLRRLSHYDIVDLDADEDVHCLRRVTVGLVRDRDLILRPHPARNPKNYTMAHFTRFLRHSFGLKRSAPALLGAQPGKKPRMLIITRTGTRKILNIEELVAMAEELGFDAVAAEAGGNVKRFAVAVNSCDVLLAVHGAGMTNMVFLPPGAVVVQVVPWGKMDWMAANFYGAPASGMGLQHVQYDIAAGESSLKDKYPSDHAVFTDPMRIHGRGWKALSETIMAQDVMLNLTRFRPTLLEALDLLQF